MSMPIGGLRPSGPTPLRLRGLALPAVWVGFALARLKPARLRRALEAVRSGARPATVPEAQRAQDAVLAVSVRCSGEYCLQRSIATALLCRLTGCWPEWRTGIRVQPFQAHAWVVAEGVPVGENTASIGHFSTVMVVPPAVCARRDKTAGSG
jgi:hypothetical protein